MSQDRRHARHAAFQTLFEVDQTRHEPDEALEHRLGHEQELAPLGVEFARALVAGVLDNKARIDEIIARAAQSWPVEQIAATDRVALEIGTFELSFGDGTPVEVAVNEAVELAKTFGGQNSAAFVNGVLRTIAEGLAAKILV
jgi:N utilization substance protein B